MKYICLYVQLLIERRKTQKLKNRLIKSLNKQGKNGEQIVEEVLEKYRRERGMP